MMILRQIKSQTCTLNIIYFEKDLQILFV